MRFILLRCTRHIENCILNDDIRTIALLNNTTRESVTPNGYGVIGNLSAK